MQVEIVSSEIGYADAGLCMVAQTHYLGVVRVEDPAFTADPIAAVQGALDACEARLGQRDIARVIVVTPEERDFLYRAIRLRLGVEAMRFKPQSDYPRQFLGVHEILVRMA